MIVQGIEIEELVILYDKLRYKVSKCNKYLLKDLQEFVCKYIISVKYTKKFTVAEYNNRIKDIENKIKEEQELEQYNFTFEDIMLKRDLESIKELNSPYYRNMFKMKWEELSLKEKQDLMMSYIETIEVIKTNKDIKIKNINFRKTFIEEYANLFNNGGINKIPRN